MAKENNCIRWFETLISKDVPRVGAKNASLGEMIRTLKKEGVGMPDGFATTSGAYWGLVEANQLRAKIKALLAEFVE